MIKLSHVNKKYGRKRVLHDVSFTADKGEITCLIGINGVGKSTILKAIMGLTPIHGGQITVDDQSVRGEMYERITFIPDTITMPPQMKVGTCLQLMRDFHRRWNDKRAEELIQFFKLDRNVRISDLSKGNAAKANLLLGLALDADYVLMDEPFSGIDMFSREQIANVFTSHLIEDRGVIITTHEIKDIEHLIDQVILLEEGTVFKQFNAEEIRMAEGKSVTDVMREVYLG